MCETRSSTGTLPEPTTEIRTLVQLTGRAILTPQLARRHCGTTACIDRSASLRHSARHSAGRPQDGLHLPGSSNPKPVSSIAPWQPRRNVDPALPRHARAAEATDGAQHQIRVDFEGRRYDRPFVTGQSTAATSDLRANTHRWRRRNGYARPQSHRISESGVATRMYDGGTSNSEVPPQEFRIECRVPTTVRGRAMASRRSSLSRHRG